MKKKSALRSLLVAAALFSGYALAAETALCPPEIKGEAVYVPFPIAIALDGKTDDWAGIPLVSVDRGPSRSANPAEDGSFRFALAAGVDRLYVLMLATDQTIITGQHGADWWNEDSMEFYLNLGKKFNLGAYNGDVAQFNIKPLDIGKADPAQLTISGNNTDYHEVQGIVFKTKEGWGFEAAVSLIDKLAPVHGLEIGFQAQLNGASSKDRNVKLIWSNADTADNSWQNPKLFGRALFFRTGSATVPQPSAMIADAPKPVPAPKVQLAVNQTGYPANAVKTAMLARDKPGTLDWSLVDSASGKTVASGKTTAGEKDQTSGDMVHRLDFSTFTKPGSYKLMVDGTESPVFRIANDIYQNLARDSLAYFYRSRSGVALPASLAGTAWARAAGHLSDDAVSAWTGTDPQGKTWPGYPYQIDGSKGWYDAGDYGKYVVNGGISVWTLLNAYERKAAAFKDGAASIPESGNEVPDILDEVRWEMDFLLNMQIPAGQALAGMVFHKLHDQSWSGVPAPLPARTAGRFVYEPSTAATLNLAATAAQASRVFKKFDPEYAGRCLRAAQSAWKAALAHPDLLAGNVPGNGGGNYDDANVKDDFYWAAAELFAATAAPDYLDYLGASPYFRQFPGLDAKAAASMSWGDTAALGSITLAVVPTMLPKSDITRLRDQICATADRYLATQQGEGYLVPMDASGYVWGSNSVVLNNLLIMGLAHDFTGKAAYLDGMVHGMDYLLGANGLNKSFVSGYGADPLAHPHHRLWANSPDSGYPAPPPGVVAGGPNASIQDPSAEAAKLGERPVAKRYLDLIGSYATNEVAINWNAPLVWVANFLDQKYGQK